MKTQIQAFCKEFSEKLRPFSHSLESALAVLNEKTEHEPLEPSLLKLQEVRTRLASLEDKIERQQAYLLIFGPLKSGKSTLMNAIAGSYVSEVSSLPAYPALVYVKNGEERKYQAFSHSGEKREFSNGEAMSRAVTEAHRELARRILEVERNEEEFDPKRHFPEAIRRMEVELPAPNLADSGSILVDTPGLYSRMKFGYDLMTRDFRDTAACAIFVVKTDNLFFEKVFEEFNQLLGSFSRIFLVANIDTSKKDLNPDGSLEPSLESRDPNAIIKAFQSLSMSAPLREAYEEGRLNVYPIDLLRAASRMLQEGSSETDADESGQEGEDIGFADFEGFLNDLTDYLNSSDYLQEFMQDSLRFGADLGKEASQVVLLEITSQLDQLSEFQTERLEQVRVKQESIERLEQIDWSAAFDGIYAEKDRLLEEISEQYSKRLAGKLQEYLQGWMESDDSLRGLGEGMNELIGNETRDDATSILEQLRSLLDNGHGGARFGTEQLRALQQADLDVSQIVPRLLTHLGENIEPGRPRIDLEKEAIPVKRSFLDIVFFRSPKRVRNQLFGSDGELSIPVRKKQKRLEGEGIETLTEWITEYPCKSLPEERKRFVDQILDEYVKQYTQTMRRQLSSLKGRLNQRKGEIEEVLSEVREVRSVCDALQQSTQKLAESISILKGRYHTFEREPEEDADCFAEETDDSGGLPANSLLELDEDEPQAIDLKDEDSPEEPEEPTADDVPHRNGSANSNGAHASVVDSSNRFTEEDER